MKFTLSELTPRQLKSIFEHAFMDCTSSSDDRCVVNVDGLKIIVDPHPDKEALKLCALTESSHSEQLILHFCNRFNANAIMASAACLDQPGSRNHLIVFNHDRMCFQDDSIEPQTIVLLARRFAATIHSGVERLDTDGLF